jgi:hypothetical protein
MSSDGSIPPSQNQQSNEISGSLGLFTQEEEIKVIRQNSDGYIAIERRRFSSLSFCSCLAKQVDLPERSNSMERPFPAACRGGTARWTANIGVAFLVDGLMPGEANGSGNDLYAHRPVTRATRQLGLSRQGS